MTPTNTDAAREAGLVALKQFPVLDGRVVRLHSDAVIDAFLSKAIEGADEKLAEIRKYAGVRKGISEFEVLGRHSKVVESHRDYLLTLVTALSAKLKAQKAAHSKLLRDEADRQRNFAWGPDGHLGNAHSAETLRRLADKIEGGE